MPDLRCEFCGDGAECGICGRGAGQALPTVNVRWLIRREITACVRIERETCGDWDHKKFLALNLCRSVVMYVAEDATTGLIRGFLALNHWPHTLEVLNLAAVDPVARRGLLAKLREVAARHGKQVVWPTGVE